MSVRTHEPESCASANSAIPAEYILLSKNAMVGRGGFEPPKSVTADLQSAPFGHSGTYPRISIVKVLSLLWGKNGAGEGT